jgi:hypothetical protein
MSCDPPRKVLGARELGRTLTLTLSRGERGFAGAILRKLA